MTGVTLQKPLILASTSPARRMLLSDAGLGGVEFMAPDCDEEGLKPDIASLPISEQALFLAEAKARSIARLHPDAWVIGADQMGAIDGMVLGKPGSHEAARGHLYMLRGNTHQQHTATCIAKGEEILWCHVHVSHLTMRAISDEDVESYLTLDEPYQCCGGYRLESYGKHLFSSIDGDFDAIAGIPLVPLLDTLYRLQIVTLG